MGEYDSKVVSFQQESGFVHQRALMNLARRELSRRAESDSKGR